jgi:hypothetical protein
MDVERRYSDSEVGTIRDVTYQNIHLHSSGGALIQGMPSSPIENLTMQNITMRIAVPLDYANRRKPKGSARNTPDDRDTLYARKPSYLTLAHVLGLTVDNVRVLMSEDTFAAYERTAVGGYHLHNGVLRNVQREPAGDDGQIAIIDLHDCTNIVTPS